MRDDLAAAIGTVALADDSKRLTLPVGKMLEGAN
jgi:hypothetical protein